MRKVLLFLSFILPFSILQVPAFANHPTADSSITVKYYNLNLNVNISSQQITCSALIKVAPFNTPVQNFFLNFSSNMNIDSLSILGSSAAYSHTGNRVYISSSVLKPEYLIYIYYHGVPVPTSFGSFEFSTHSGTPVVWSLSEPYGAEDWFPCKNSITDKADSSALSITCPEGYTGVSNGILKSVIHNIDGTVSYFWKNSYPISGYLISVAISNYYFYEKYFKYSQTDSMPILNYIYPEDFESVKQSLDKTSYFLSVFSGLFSEYPFLKEKYGHAEINKNGGMEHQTITSLGNFSEGVIAHELSHQWFGDKVTCRDWHHIWLNEGFASYSEALIEEVQSGDSAYKSIMINKMLDAKNAKGSIYVQDIDLPSEIFNSSRSYSKGAVVLHMLRGILGDSVFFRILKKYVNDSTLAYKTAVTEDFQRVCEYTSNLNLKYFFDEWIYGENYPSYILSYTFTSVGSNLYDVTINLSQKVNTNPSYFIMPLEVLIKNDFKDTTLIIYNYLPQQRFSFIINGKPESMELDPNNLVLKDKKGDEPVTAVQYALKQNYPNPFNPITTIEYEILKYQYIKLAIYDITGKEVSILENGKQAQGHHKVQFDGSGLSSGIYFYTLYTEDRGIDSKKMILVK